MPECDREGNEYAVPNKPDISGKSEGRTACEFECEEIDLEIPKTEASTEASTEIDDLQITSDLEQKIEAFSVDSGELSQLRQQLEDSRIGKDVLAEEVRVVSEKLAAAMKVIHDHNLSEENAENNLAALEPSLEMVRLKDRIQEIETRNATLTADFEIVSKQKVDLGKEQKLEVQARKKIDELFALSKAEEARLQEELQSLKERVLQLRSEKYTCEQEKAKALYRLEELLQTSETQALELQGEKDKREEENAKILQSLEVLTTENAGLAESLTRLRQGLEEEREEKKRVIAGMEERLGTVENELASIKQEKLMLELALQTLEADSQAQLQSYNEALREREEHCEKIMQELMEIENEKVSLAKAVQELEHQLAGEKSSASDAVRNLETCRQQHLHETAQLRSELASLRKDVVSSKSMPVALAKEKDAVEKELGKIKNKLKDTESKLKIALQERTTVQTEKANMERELKKLRQSNLLSRDINKRESVVEKRRESMAHNLAITKRQSSTIEHKFQNKSNELERVQFELQMLQEAHERLETAHNELQLCIVTLGKKLEEKDGRIGKLQNSDGESSRRLQLEFEKAKKEVQLAEAEVTSLREEYTRLLSIAQMREVELKEASARAAELPMVQRELQEVTQLLLNTRASFEEKESQFVRQQMASALEKQKMVARLAEVEETVKKLEAQVQACSKEAKELQDQLEEEKTVKELLEQKLSELENSIAIEKEQMALEHASQVNVFDARIELLSDQLQEVQDEVKDAEKLAESTRKESKEKLITMEVRNRNLSEKLKEMATLLKKMEANEKRMLEEEKEFCTVNTKLEVAFDAAKCRLEVFADRLAEADRENRHLRDKITAAAQCETSVTEMAKPDSGRSGGDTENNEAFREIKIEDLEKEAQVLELMEENRILKEELEKIEEQRRCAKAWKEELKRRQSAEGQQDSSELMEKRISSLMDDLQKTRLDSETEKHASKARQLQLERHMGRREAQLEKVATERNGLQTEVRQLSARYASLLRSQPINNLRNSRSLQNDSPHSDRSHMQLGVLGSLAKQNSNSSFTTSIPSRKGRETKKDDRPASRKEANVSEHEARSKEHEGSQDMGSVTKSSHGGYDKENVSIG